MRVDELVSLRLRGDPIANEAFGYWVYDVSKRLSRLAPEHVRGDVTQRCALKIIELTSIWDPDRSTFTQFAKWIVGSLTRMFIDAEVCTIHVKERWSGLRKRVRNNEPEAIEEMNALDFQLFPTREIGNSIPTMYEEAWADSRIHTLYMDMSEPEREELRKLLHGELLGKKVARVVNSLVIAISEEI